MAEQKKKTTRDFFGMRAKGEKIAWITAYSYPEAYCAEKAGIDLLLAGDSGGMTELGYSSTKPVTMDECITFCKAVRRGAPNTFLVGDFPLGSYGVSDSETARNAVRFMQEGDCDAVKLEGGERIAESVRVIRKLGIPVIGHLGLTPQSAEVYKAVGRNGQLPFEYVQDARTLSDSGCFAILHEALTVEATDEFVRGNWETHDSTIQLGIGSGPNFDGQLIILHDIIGWFPNFTPRFAKNYVGEVLTQSFYPDPKFENTFLNIATRAIQCYIRDVKAGTFPDSEHSYHASKRTPPEPSCNSTT